MPTPRMNRPANSMALFCAAARRMAPRQKTKLASRVVGLRPMRSFKIPPIIANMAAAPTKKRRFGLGELEILLTELE